MNNDGGLRYWQEQGQYQSQLDKDKHMKLDDMIPSKYLKQSDIGDEEKLVTITKLQKVNVARDDETPEYKWTVKFAEFEKPMALNSTNIKRIGKALGDDTDGWMQQKVVLYVDPDVEFGGNVVGGLRIRAATKVRRASSGDVDEGNRKAAAASADLDSDIPF